MSTPGSKEIKRWLGGPVEPVSLALLRSAYPDALCVRDPTPAALQKLLLRCPVTGLKMEWESTGLHLRRSTAC